MRVHAETIKQKIGIKDFIIDKISIIAIVVMLLGFTIINPRFLGLKNIGNLLGDMSTLLAISIGMTFVLLLGSIDLSVGAICSCACVTVVMTMERFGAFSFVIALAMGVLAGVINGILNAKLKIPSFIATFGTMCFWESAAMLIAGGASQQIKKDYYFLIDWYKIKVGFLPLPFLLVTGITILMIIAQNKTTFGKRVYAVGGNESAARYIGMPVIKTKIAVFAIAGLFGAVGGILLACKLKSGIPSIGESFNMMAIAAVALGGTSMSGGKGGLLKTVAGSILITLIQNGMNVVGINAYWQNTTFGIIILAAVWLTTDRKRRQLIVK